MVVVPIVKAIITTKFTKKSLAPMLPYQMQYAACWICIDIEIRTGSMHGNSSALVAFTV